MKTSVSYDWDATTRLKQLKPARFNFISDSTDTLVDGFLAFEIIYDENKNKIIFTNRTKSVKSQEIFYIRMPLTSDSIILSKFENIQGTRLIPLLKAE